LVQNIDCFAEVSPEIVVCDEVIDEIVQDPVTESGKGTDTNNPSILLRSIDSPFQAGKKQGKKMARREIAAER
jgi:hypothetical protein